MKNPYRVRNRTLTTKIDDAEWQKIWLGCPEHGLQNALLAQLIHKFIELTNGLRPSSFSAESSAQLTALVQRLTLTRPD